MKSSKVLFLASILSGGVLAAGDGRFDVTGQVMTVCHDMRCNRYIVYIVQDNTSISIWDENPEAAAYGAGDIVRAQGRIDLTSNPRRTSYATQVDVIAHAPNPPTIAVDGAQIVRAEDGFPPACVRGAFVRVRGVVSAVLRDDIDAYWNWIVLRTPTGDVFASVTEHEYPLADIGRLKDAEVELSGEVSRFTYWRKFLGNNLMLFGKDGLRVILPPPEDPFAAPKLAEGRSLHRQRVAGRVLAVSRERVFLRSEDGRFIPVRLSAGQPPPAVGERVVAAGFPDPDPFNVQLAETLLRPADGGAADGGGEPVADIEAERLFADETGHARIDTSVNGRLVRLRGVVKSLLPEPSVAGSGLVLECGGHAVTVDMSALTVKDAASVRQGCVLDVVGLCLAEFENGIASLQFPRFRRFVVVPRSPADLRIVAQPPWWTPRRLLAVIVALLMAFAAVLWWNTSLRRISERRGRELLRTALDHARAEQKVEERTRLSVELHDAISQTLTGVALQIDAALGSCGNDIGIARRFLESARQMLVSCRQELRCCLWDLRSRTFEEKDMTEAVMRTLAPHAGAAKVSVRFNVPRKRLSESMTHAILKIVRELVVNAIRHGKAAHVRVAGEQHGSAVSFSVCDDGCGFDVKSHPGAAEGHFGLQGIRERLNELDGQMDISSEPGKGTRVCVVMQLKEKEG